MKKLLLSLFGLLLLFSSFTGSTVKTFEVQLSQITEVVLTFTPIGGGPSITATASDPDDAGLQGLTITQNPTLDESAEYSLAISLRNTATNTNINDEINAAREDYQFFFAAGENLFDGSPAYSDTDSNGLPVGLMTNWTTACTEANTTDTLRIVLNHLPGSKTADSTIDDGTAELDLTWTITLEDDPNAPPCENEEEVIDKVTLTFTPKAGGDPVVAIASDPDGPGPLDLQLEDITLDESTEYDLSITVENTIEGEDITAEIQAEDDEHMFFFSWTDAVFRHPDGDGNVDNRSDEVGYLDMDENGLPVGLSTTWETDCVEENTAGSFRVILKHQPGVKTATSTVDDGGTDIDLTFNISVQDAPDAPPCENEEEVIDKVTLTFTPKAGGDPVVAIASDPDGPGPLDLQLEDITLDESTEYDLSITVENTIEGEDITAEIQAEDDEHMFFFSWTDAVFRHPDGDGNVDNRSDEVNYLDMDENGLPVGLSTTWETDCVEENTAGSFRVILKHQPGVKTATSTVDDGGTDLDLTFNIAVQDDPNAPPCENEEEVIDKVTLTFTPKAGGDPVVAIASDPDGPGPLDLQLEDIILDESTEYDLAITLENTIEGEDITAEIQAEDDEHMFFFSWTDAVFRHPDGDGNVDNRSDEVGYLDMDENGLPVGLSTTWETDCVEENTAGSFRVILKHQPGVKTATSTVDDGGTDLDLTFNIAVQDDPNAPPCENEEEVIDKVTLTFTPKAGGDPVVAIASDPDGPGPLDLQLEDITLAESTEYDLSITVENTIEGEDITAEIQAEDDEHMFFFSWTEGLFSSPAGDGNVDNRSDEVNYLDMDENGLPLGLSTNWTVNSSMPSGVFRLILKHQPGVKSATSTVNDGGTDLDLTWNINTVITNINDPILETKPELRVFPNPVSQTLNWRLEDIPEERIEIRILDLTGRVVSAFKNTTSGEISVQSLAPGNYLLRIQSEKRVWIEKFVKF